MSDIEIIDGNDILKDRICGVHEVIELAIARANEYDRPAHVKFTFNAIIITVAADSDLILVTNTVRMQGYRPDKSVPGEVGPYPAMLTFDGDKAKPYGRIVGEECLPVLAYQLDEDAWMERVDEEGTFTNWFGFAGDWYVKNVNDPKVDRVADADFVKCPCPSHK